MTSNVKPVNNPFRRMVPSHEEEVIDMDDNNNDQADYNNYDYNDNYSNDYQSS